MGLGLPSDDMEETTFQGRPLPSTLWSLSLDDCPLFPGDLSHCRLRSLALRHDSDLRGTPGLTELRRLRLSSAEGLGHGRLRLPRLLELSVQVGFACPGQRSAGAVSERLGLDRGECLSVKHTVGIGFAPVADIHT